MNSLNFKDLSGNEAEDTFYCQLYADNLVPVVREHPFHPERKFRFDFAWPDRSPPCAIEIDGAIFTKGAHSRPLGILRDLEKHNLAVLAGWRVLRVTPAQVKNGEALKMTKSLLRMHP